MRFLPHCIVLFAVSATIPAICQSSQGSTKATLVTSGGAAAASQPAESTAPAVSSSALRADIARQDKVIQNQIGTQQNLLKKNKELMKEAKKLDEKN